MLTPSLTHTARAYTLTGLTNYEWYTVTLHAMVGSASFISDTVRVMPTGIFVYLLFVFKGDVHAPTGHHE